MSIRLRLTLLYSAILALTLVAFSSALYLMQSQVMMREFEMRLAGATRFLEEPERLHTPATPAGWPARPRFGLLLYTQRRNLEGEVIEADPNLGGFFLPLTNEGFKAVSRGEKWVEVASVEGERFLIHSQVVNWRDGNREIIQIGLPMTERDQYLSTLRRILIIGSSVAVLFAFVIGWLLAGVTLRPINRIRHTAQAIGAERDFGRRVDHEGPNDEIGKLATTFNDMLSQLQAAYLQVEQSLQAQKRFVADASHELRTPLTTIRGNLGLLRRDPPISDEDQIEVLDDTVAETERVMRLVGDLLVLARVDAKRPLSSEPVAIKPLMEGILGQTKLLTPRTIVCDDMPQATVMGDRDALKQVFLALLDNALKHTPPEAAITVGATVDAEAVSIHVGDEGPGIPSELMPHIFDRFSRGDKARTESGTGLGLAIAKELAEAQNGTITVESQVGQGTVFTVTVPKAPLPNQP